MRLLVIGVRCHGEASGHTAVIEAMQDGLLADSAQEHDFVHAPKGPRGTLIRALRAVGTKEERLF